MTAIKLQGECILKMVLKHIWFWFLCNFPLKIKVRREFSSWSRKSRMFLDKGYMPETGETRWVLALTDCEGGVYISDPWIALDSVGIMRLANMADKLIKEHESGLE